MKFKQLIHSFYKYSYQKILGYLLINGVFALFLFLHEAPMDSLVDAIYFTCPLIILYQVSSYYKEQKKLRRLSDITKQLTNLTPHDMTIFPSPSTEIETAYQGIIQDLILAKNTEQRAYKSQYLELMDYYMMWTHQIKTPLAALSLLIQTESTDTKKMLNELAKVDRYLQMMLYHLKLPNIKNDLLIKHYPMKELVMKAIKKFIPFFIEKELKLTVTIENEIVLTDEKWFVFIVEQIVSNAIKYTETGEIHCSMQADRLVIEDTGMGIAPQDLPRIFEKGYTGFNGRQESKSTGLGLYMCNQVAQSLGLIIDVASDLGKGTKVFVSFHPLESQIE